MKILSYHDDGTPNEVSYAPNDPVWAVRHEILKKENDPKITKLNSSDIYENQGDYSSVFHTPAPDILKDEIEYRINSCKHRSCSCAGAKCLLDPINIIDVTKDDCRKCPLVQSDPEPDPSKGFGGNISAKPSLIDRAMSLGKSVINHVAAGAPTLTDEQAQARLDICQKCEHVLQNTVLGPQCGVCRCFLKVKTRMALEVCPLQPPKWSAQE